MWLFLGALFLVVVIAAAITDSSKRNEEAREKVEKSRLAEMRAKAYADYLKRTSTRPSVRQRQAIPEPASPNIFRYRVSADTVMRGQYSSSGVQKDSCVEAAKNPDGTPPIHGNDILVQAFGEDGEDIRSGLIPRDVLRNQGVRGSCHAVFLETQIPDALETQGPIQQWGVDGSSDLRDKPDPTAPIIGSLRTGSCVMSTGKVKGHFMEVTIDTGVEQRTLWTAIQNYKPTVIETCQAKTIFTH